MTDIIVGDDKYVLKPKISLEDYLKVLRRNKPEEAEGFDLTIDLICSMVTSGNLTREDLLKKDFKYGLEFIRKTAHYYGLDEQIDFLEEK